jgi:hypothetical protein
MADLDRLQEDLGFVRSSVAKAGEHRSGPAVYFMWSVLTLAGFALVDIRPVWVGAYWMIAGPIGGIVSAYLGARHNARLGHINKDVGRRYAWHWGAFFATTLLMGLMAGRGLSFEAFGSLMLLLLALSYFLAGIHIDPPLRWIGLLAAGGYVAVLTRAPYAWSIAGLALAVAFVLSGVREARKDVLEARAV